MHMHTNNFWPVILLLRDIKWNIYLRYRRKCKDYNIYSNSSNCVRFYSASALFAMQIAVLARGILSACPSVRPSVTLRCFVQTNEDTIVPFSASGRTLILISAEVKFIRIFAGDSPLARALNRGTPLSLTKISQIIGHNLETVQDRRQVTINH